MIPVDEYRVGALLYAPHILKPEEIERPTSQLDIAPTILGLLGGSYRTTFFGKNLFKPDEESDFALMVYNKKRYGIISGSRLTILGETGDYYTYKRKPDNTGWLETPYSEEHGYLATFSTAILQTAEKLLQERKYHMQIDRLVLF